MDNYLLFGDFEDIVIVINLKFKGFAQCCYSDSKYELAV